MMDETRLINTPTEVARRLTTRVELGDRRVDELEGDLRLVTTQAQHLATKAGEAQNQATELEGELRHTSAQVQRLTARAHEEQKKAHGLEGELQAQRDENECLQVTLQNQSLPWSLPR